TSIFAYSAADKSRLETFPRPGSAPPLLRLDDILGCLSRSTAMSGSLKTSRTVRQETAVSSRQIAEQLHNPELHDSSTLRSPTLTAVSRPVPRLLLVLVHALVIAGGADPSTRAFASGQSEEPMRKCLKQQQAPRPDKVLVPTCHRAQTSRASLPHLRANQTGRVVWSLPKDPPR